MTYFAMSHQGRREFVPAALLQEACSAWVGCSLLHRRILHPAQLGVPAGVLGIQLEESAHIRVAELHAAEQEQ
jgi:hypothetical protein